jgi:hypothetical protein
MLFNIYRKMYVFKIIPFLNPDGVSNGLYRSDTLGHNLNRVYLTPNLETQPSIYAARKLIRYFYLSISKISKNDSHIFTGTTIMAPMTLSRMKSMAKKVAAAHLATPAMPTILCVATTLQTFLTHLHQLKNQ